MTPLERCTARLGETVTAATLDAAQQTLHMHGADSVRAFAFSVAAKALDADCAGNRKKAQRLFDHRDLYLSVLA